VDGYNIGKKKRRSLESNRVPAPRRFGRQPYSVKGSRPRERFSRSASEAGQGRRTGSRESQTAKWREREERRQEGAKASELAES
jgi:hypothetical protein